MKKKTKIFEQMEKMTNLGKKREKMTDWTACYTDTFQPPWKINAPWTLPLPDILNNLCPPPETPWGVKPCTHPP